MRSKLGKVLRKQFETRVREAYPGFSAPRKVQGDLDFEWQVAEDASLYLCLQVSLKDDSFTIEVGHGKPGVTFVSLRPMRLDDPFEASCRLRLAELRPGRYVDRWWYVDDVAFDKKFDASDPDTFHVRFSCAHREPTPEDVCLARLPPVLDHAFREIAGLAVPLWKELCHRRGVALEV